MKQLLKDYYALPEAAERTRIPIDDILYLAEGKEIMLSVKAHHWPIVWGDEREFLGELPNGINEPTKPPFEYYNSGYLNLFWYDICQLREDGKLSLMAVYAKKDDREFIGDIQRGTTDFRGQQHECELELSNVFISHEELQRIENNEVGDWGSKKELASSGDTADGRSARKAKTQSKYKKWQRKYTELKDKHKNMTDNWCAQQISKWLTAQGYPPTTRGFGLETIRKNMKPK
jgi:hypothetical protein